MRRRITGELAFVVTGRDDVVVMDHDGSDRDIVMQEGGVGLFDRKVHEGSV